VPKLSKCIKKKNPDFKINGKRKVIEVGDIEYWHTQEEINETIDEYKKIGYECLYFTNRDIDNNWSFVQKEIVKFSKDGEIRKNE